MKSIKIKADNLNVYYGEKQALFDVSMYMEEKQVTALIGPSGCGKSTFIRCLNRMNDVIDICKVQGKIEIDGNDIYAPDMQVEQLRERVGMVFQKPNPFPKSIFENVAYGPRIHGIAEHKSDLEEIVVTSLKKAALFDEVKDRLSDSGTSLSGGQQQRLCIARAISVNPDIILMVETYGSGPYISNELGYNFHLIASEDTALNDKSVNLSVFSKFPFGERIDTDFPFFLGGTEIIVHGTKMNFFSN